MARVTVEDCLEKEENRFALVILAAQRTRQIMKGARPKVGGLALLKPSYLALGLDQGRVTDEDREELPPDTLPLAYEGTVAVGGRAIRLSGAAR